MSVGDGFEISDLAGLGIQITNEVLAWRASILASLLFLLSACSDTGPSLAEFNEIVDATCTSGGHRSIHAIYIDCQVFEDAQNHYYCVYGLEPAGQVRHVIESKGLIEKTEDGWKPKTTPISCDSSK